MRAPSRERLVLLHAWPDGDFFENTPSSQRVKKEHDWRYICSIVDEGLGGYHANYKQAVAEYVRDGAKTIRQGVAKGHKRINSSMSWEARECGLRCRDSIVSVVERDLSPWWRELLINYLVVLIITRCCDYFMLNNHRLLFNQHLFNPFIINKLIIIVYDTTH